MKKSWQLLQSKGLGSFCQSSTLLLICLLLACPYNLLAQPVAQEDLSVSSEESLHQNSKKNSKKQKKQKNQKKQKKQESTNNEKYTFIEYQDTTSASTVVFEEVEDTEWIIIEEVADPELVVVEEIEAPELVVVEEVEEPELVVVEEVAEPELVVVEEVAESPLVESSLANIPRNYTKFIATEVVGKDSRLAWISYKYYGVKDFWVYIYEANLDRVSYPDYVKPGQKLRIPALDSKYTDLNNPEVQKLLLQLSQEYLKH